MRAQDTPKGISTSMSVGRDAIASRRLLDGGVNRAVWFEATPTEWQDIADEESDPGYIRLPMK